MKKSIVLLTSLLAIMAASVNLNAQEITITLNPGWNWISYPNATVMGISEALDGFTPMEGDIIKSQSSATYYQNGRWRGSITQFNPGIGYHYYSARTEATGVVFAQAPSPFVTTVEPINITAISAEVGGTVTINAGNHIFVRGVCWGTEEMPTIDGSHMNGDADAGSQSITLDGLTPNTTYYVRAYVVTDNGLAYGNEVSFTTLEGSTIPQGAINGKFTINASGNQVYFSQGNLQYIGSAVTPYWKFAENQWDILGTTTGQDSDNVNVDRDLFGWGTSGYNHGAICYQPWSTSENNVDYNPYGDSYANLYDQTGQADWGYNAIINGENQENQWRTLGYSEWNYLLDTRSTASGIRFAMAQVNNVNGVILLPDNWDAGIYQLSNTNLHGANYNSNIITASEWNSLEASGAVFLPVAGKRSGTTVGSVGSRTYYWTSTSSGESGASALLIEDGFIATGFTFRASGYAIRLVHNLSASLPEVSTLEPTNISITTATVGGVVYNNGGNAITECGVCWSTEQNSTIEGNHIIVEGVTSGEFTMELTDLVPNTTYYVRAYAIIDNDFVYGEELTFTTLEGGSGGNAPTGAIDGLFSVSATQQVYFSQGNLQYIGSASTPYWKFADNQWEYFGTTTNQNSTSQNVDRDLFGWGTSGYHDVNDPYNVYYQPWSTSSSEIGGYNYFGYGPSMNMTDLNLTGTSANYDWGVYNPISDGGNTTNYWRTLSRQEWRYVFNTRTTTSGIRFAKAQVNDVNGVILLPDNWNSSTYNLSNTNTNNASFSSNVISATQWMTLEAAGAVFLPASGVRNGVSVNSGTGGRYWSTTNGGSGNAWYVGFSDNSLDAGNGTILNYHGFSVRLVCVPPQITSFVIDVTANPAEGGVVIGGGSYQEGTESTLTATAIEGYTFTNWTENGEVVSTNATYTFTVNANRTLVANFTYNGSGDAPIGAIDGKFTINSDGGQVFFSQGNLQYQASTNTWRFANEQWDFVGSEVISIGPHGGTVNGSSNHLISENYDGWIDLFGWGTSGYDHGAVCYQPWSTNNTGSNYFAYGSRNFNLNDSTGMADWGYNAISNGCNQENRWRTLTQPEWSYLFFSRNTVSGIRFAKAQVAGVNGMILLPDNWSESTYYLNNTNVSGASYNSNIIDAIQWSMMEIAGAVFLPTAGNRNGSSVNYTDSHGNYWTSTYYNGSQQVYDGNEVISLFFSDVYFSTYKPNRRSNGYNVRLVHDAE